MEAINIENLQWTVAVLGFVLAFVFGFTAQASNFCTMGAIADIANFGDWTRARLVLTAIASAIFFTALLIYLSDVDVSKSIYAAPKLNWLSHIVGGLAFGFGMTIASGCGSKTLLRAGGGSLKAVVVLLVMGIAAYMTLRGILAVFRVNVLDSVTVTLTGSQLAPALLGLEKSGAFFFSAAVAAAVLAFVLGKTEFRVQPKLIFAGAIIGLTVAGGWWVTAKIGFVPEHPQTLESVYVGTNSGRPESFSFTAPTAYFLELLMLWSDKSKIVTFGIAAVLGMFAGGAVAAVVLKLFRWESFANAEDLANHLVGGALMGFGGVTALGCTIGQGASGLSVLSLGAVITVVAIIVGSRLALNYQMWRLEQMDRAGIPQKTDSKQSAEGV